MKKGNVLAVLLATVGIMLFGTLAVSADAHAGIQSASGKSSVPTAIAENESGAVTSAKASVGKTRNAKASVNAVADSAAKPDIAMLPWICTRRQHREA